MNMAISFAVFFVCILLCIIFWFLTKFNKIPIYVIIFITYMMVIYSITNIVLKGLKC